MEISKSSKHGSYKKNATGTRVTTHARLSLYMSLLIVRIHYLLF